MDIKLFNTVLVIGVLVGATAWYVTDSTQNKEAELAAMTANVYGDWVAAEGFCNTNVKGIDGVDITNEFFVKNGKRTPIKQVLITPQETTMDMCNQGVIKYDYEFTLLPTNETFHHGSMGAFELIKSVEDSVIYFKMSQEFKKKYELFHAKIK
jgi:hypothetical protein